jgi:hypothetical protein
MTIKTDNSAVIQRLQAENIDLINELAKCRDVFTFDEEMMQEALGNPLGVANFVESKVKQLKAENEALKNELSEWEKLKDPNTLHVNLLRGFPARLTKDQLDHLKGK